MAQLAYAAADTSHSVSDFRKRKVKMIIMFVYAFEARIQLQGRDYKKGYVRTVDVRRPPRCGPPV